MRRYLMKRFFLLLLCLVLSCGAAIAAPSPAAGTEGIAFRFFWYAPRKPGAARVVRFEFPVGADYPTQEVREVSALYPGAAFRRDGEGATVMSYAAPIPLREGQDLLLGFAARGRFALTAAETVDKGRVSWASPLPAEVRGAFLERRYLSFSADDARILGPAQRILSDRPDPVLAMRRVWDLVHGSLSYRPLKRPNTAAQILEAGSGWCGEYTRLTVALLRACGLPARGVYGFALAADGPTGNSHAWTETYLPGHGWTPVQPQVRLPAKDAFPYLSHYVMRRYANEYDDGWIAAEAGPSRAGSPSYAGRKALLYDIAAENAYTSWVSGVGFFAPVPLSRSAAVVDLLQRIAADDGTGAAALLAEVSAADASGRPMLYYALAASRDENAGRAAAEALVKACRASGGALSLEKFLDEATDRIRRRLQAAAGG